MDSSDKTHRTLVDALQAGNLSDEAREFLTADRPPPPPGHPAGPPAALPTPTADRYEPPNPPPNRRHQTTMTLKSPPQLSVVIPAIVSMSFRLPANLSAQLIGVAAERKLRREPPFTQQDIVAEALRDWFRRHEYHDFER